MRVVLCNNRYFRSSGPETYLFGVKAALEARGHEVHPFAVRLADNQPAPDDDLFVDAPGGTGRYLYRDYAGRLSLAQKVGAGLETIYSLRARRNFVRLLDRVRPDVVYTLNITNMLTPSIAYAARARSVPVVARFSDYSLSCAAYGYFRDGHVCLDCRGSLLPALRHRCVQGSTAVSALRVMAIQVHRSLGYLKRLQACIAPSRFLADDLLRLGASPARVHYLPTPMWDVDRLAAFQSHNEQRVPTVAFVGRVSPEKGLEFLLTAWPSIASATGARLLVIGDDHGHHLQDLRRRLPPVAFEGVEFTGALYGDALYERVASAHVVVVPSIWHDNSPNVVIEAMALGKPIVATRLGGIPDQVDASSALLVEPWDVAALSGAVRQLLGDEELQGRMGAAARRRALAEFHSSTHMDRLEQILQNVRAGAR